MEALPNVLTIAGSDSGGGAGIQADLKTISMMGAYGASAITAVTAQNTCTVSGIEGLTPDFVALQIETVTSDIKIDAAKTGMLFSAPIIRTVAGVLADKKFPLVVDPVCVAQSGSRLLREDAVEAMMEMFPLADLLTPNVPEAELFTGIEIKCREDFFKAIEILLGMGPKAVLIKGGHFDSVAATDWLGIKGQEPIPLMQQRVKCNNNHGTGCTLSAAIASGLAKGENLVTAIRHAQQFLNLALRSSFSLGEGSGPPNHLAPMLIERLKVNVLNELYDFGKKIKCKHNLLRIAPESRMNVALALPYAGLTEDVAAFSGGFCVAEDGEVLISGMPKFGASERMSKIIIAARKKVPDINCMINIRLDDAILKAMTDCGMLLKWFDRNNEPDKNRRDETSTLEWGVSEALSECEPNSVVDAVCDNGSDGHEPLIRIMAKDLNDLERKLGLILNSLN
ncbi:bifunctional hydroxymethylpyrimidine kinase/phosphomethylpyrimidine kinase [Maridesulfovibrio bastinii]|uniref:bifunctional hydroxymethylpyrimidine kinase/phosphomethylpyrimidine kinase n=1 Tax=Maridesulfovibrio bastinii TaxID=47157 RepID=UPI0003F9ED04|nr:bifunctional hydroxymethylpyrimidine kinase/phosphomethylpyrimidine kinase [Maridesulfovibrio bastinii]